jgi:O-antigen ligase
VDFRWEWMGVAWNMVLEHPLLGWGLNTFVYHLPGNTRFGGVEGLYAAFGVAWPVVHNVYLIIWSEQGTIGFLLFLVLNFYLLWIGFRNFRIAEDTLFTMNLGCLSAVLAIMTDGFGSFFFRVPPGGRVFAIVAGLIVAIDYWNKANRRVLAQEPVVAGAPVALRPTK